MSSRMNEIVVRSVVERLEVTNAPETAKIGLPLLVAAIKGIRLDDDVLWLGYPAEEEIGYRIIGFDLDQLTFDVEKI